MTGNLLIRRADVEGHVCDVRIADGLIADIGENLRGPGPTLDARGATLLPGLIDHHIHLLALAAESHSLRVTAKMDFAAALRTKDRDLPKGQDLRVTGYHDSFCGPLDAARLDAVLPHRPVRVQYRTGSLWALNTCALAQVQPSEGWPDCVERDAAGIPTGRIWRGDAWLRSRLPNATLSLTEVGQTLVRQGITHVTDTSATTCDDTAALFAAARRNTELPQHLMLMSAQPLRRSADWQLGPVKILLDDHALLMPEEICVLIADARAQQRCVAVHCVTAAELAVTLAAFGTAGTWPGDRIEHGGIIAPEALSEIRRLGLTVITQPGFVAERGDRYLQDVDPRDHDNLYRCGSLIAHGIKVGGSTDAPYTRPDVWAAIRTATHRRTRNGTVIGAAECVSPQRALTLFQSGFFDPGGCARRIAVGDSADLVLLHGSLRDMLERDPPDHVVATVIAGDVVWGREHMN
jgi:predicted amidohydrolase YtcJ